MKILYCTDIHGCIRKYNKLIDLQDDYDIIIIGGDILPKHINHFSDQLKFINNFFPDFFNNIKIPLLIDFANDDHFIYYQDFIELIKDFKHVFTHHCKEVIIEDISFIGLNNIPDYPFSLKDWCLRDDKIHTQSIIQYGKPCLSTIDGYRNIDDLYKYFTELPTLEEKLNKLPISNKNKVINIFHTPPRNLGLDVCYDGKGVGSYSITDYIAKKEPLICYSGHIHESPDITNIFWNKIGKTYCIQPGQVFGDNLLSYCSLDINDIEQTIKYIIIKI